MFHYHTTYIHKIPGLTCKLSRAHKIRTIPKCTTTPRSLYITYKVNKFNASLIRCYLDHRQYCYYIMHYFIVYTLHAGI
ncbi:unnamed protein product [Ixodes pacificus]